MRLAGCAAVLWATAIAPAALGADGPAATVIREDTTWPKDAVLRTPLVIAADGVTLDGNGATLQGPGTPGKPDSFQGVGIRCEGRARVTIRNVKVRGFESAMVAQDGRDLRIEGCDFSGNYHDPDYGWGDGKRAGGLILTRVAHSVIRQNTGRDNWNGLDLWECDDNRIEKNDFSHCSNVPLKLWQSCHNLVADNNLSWGLRISPGEVHARDSTGVLIETGSNDNRFERNDVTHGGDGIFIRPLNAWVSTGNVFVENDCSYANNNGFESWSPGNVFLRNKANHCSFGFWLGGSDRTILLGNEASYNGLPSGFHNAAESDFVHGGIVIVGGQGNHSVIDGNTCCGNVGAGIVFRGDLATQGETWKMHNLIVQNNVLEENRWGVFARFSDGVFLANNTFRANRDQDELFEAVDHLRRGEADPQGQPAPTAVLEGPSRALVGEQVSFDAAKSRDALGRPLEFFWDLAGTSLEGPKVEHVFTEPGFHRVCLLVTNGFLAGSAFRDFYAVKPVEEIATEDQADPWDWTMGNNQDGGGKVTFVASPVSLVGQRSLEIRVDPYRGADVTAIFPKSRAAQWDLSQKKHLAFWIRFQNTNNGGFQGPNPILRLHRGTAAYTYQPARGGQPISLLGDLPYAEARYGWLYVTVPLAGGDQWVRSQRADAAAAASEDSPSEKMSLDKVDAISFQFDSWSGGPLTIWLDGLAFE